MKKIWWTLFIIGVILGMIGVYLMPRRESAVFFGLMSVFCFASFLCYLYGLRKR